MIGHKTIIDAQDIKGNKAEMEGKGSMGIQNNKMALVKSSHSNNNSKCKWIEFTNQKAQTGWIKKKDPTICFLQETHFRFKDIHMLRVKGWNKLFHANGNQKKMEVALLRQNRL